MIDAELATAITTGPAATISAKVFVSDAASEAVVRESLAALGIEEAHYTTGNVRTAVSALAKDRSPDVLIVDISGVEDPVRCIRDLAEVCEPEVSVIVIGDRNDIVLYRDLKSTGIVEYFLKPLVRDLLTRTCTSIHSPHRADRGARRGKLIFILGVRGGVGATTIATNSAWYLAETLRRHTVLLDLNLKTGDAALQLDAIPTHALWEALSHPERIDKLYLERAVKPLTERLDLLASLEPLRSSLVFDEEAAIALIEKLSVRYRFVVVDLPQAAALGMKRLLDLPHTLVAVANTSLTAARDISRWSEILGENTADRSTIYLLNRTSTHGGLKLAEFLSASGKSPNVMIRYDRFLGEAAPLGIKAMQKCPTFHRSLASFLRQLTGEAQAPTSLLSRIRAR